MTHDEMMVTGTADLFIHISNLQRENAVLRATNESLLNQCSAYDTQCVEYTREIAALKAELAEVKEVDFPRKVKAVVDGWRDKCERLESELAALKAQEPVGHFYTDDRDFWRQAGDPISFPNCTKLFITPQPAAVPAKTCTCGVPQSLGIVHSADTSCYYAEAPQAKDSWEDGLCPYCYQALKESK